MSDSAAEAQAAERVVVVDLGKKKRKDVKKLRKGQGKLIGTVQAQVAALREEGSIGEASDIVVVIVERKPDNPLRRVRFY